MASIVVVVVVVVSVVGVWECDNESHSFEAQMPGRVVTGQGY